MRGSVPALSLSAGRSNVRQPRGGYCFPHERERFRRRDTRSTGTVGRAAACGTKRLPFPARGSEHLASTTSTRAQGSPASNSSRTGERHRLGTGQRPGPESALSRRRWTRLGVACKETEGRIGAETGPVRLVPKPTRRNALPRGGGPQRVRRPLGAGAVRTGAAPLRQAPEQRGDRGGAAHDEWARRGEDLGGLLALVKRAREG